MAGRYRTKRSRSSRSAKAGRCCRVVGLGTGAGAVLAFGVSPLAAAPPAHADGFDIIIDPIINAIAGRI
jgi:hypothetical protein